MEKNINKYAKMYKEGLESKNFSEINEKVETYKNKLREMYTSEVFKEHNIYPTMDMYKIYAVICMCLMLKSYNLTNNEIMEIVNYSFKKARKLFDILSKIINVLPNSYNIARKWNISDHDKRVIDKSITYDDFTVTDKKIEYKISKCMYVEIFKYYGIRELCKIFCETDERIYANIPRHVKYIRHSELATGDTCHDEIMYRK